MKKKKKKKKRQAFKRLTTYTPVLQLRVWVRVVGHAVPLQLGLCVIRSVRFCVNMPQPLHGGLQASQLHTQLIRQQWVLQCLVSSKAPLHEAPPHIAATAIPLLRCCVPVSHDFVQGLQGCQFPRTQSRKQRLRRLRRHESTPQRNALKRRRAIDKVTSFIERRDGEASKRCNVVRVTASAN